MQDDSPSFKNSSVFSPLPSATSNSDPAKALSPILSLGSRPDGSTVQSNQTVSQFDDMKPAIDSSLSAKSKLTKKEQQGNQSKEHNSPKVVY